MNFFLCCCVLLIFPTLQSLEVDLGDSLVEGLALGGSELELLGGGLARAVTVLSWCVSLSFSGRSNTTGEITTYGESTSAPGTATTDLAVVAEDAESGLVSKRNIDDTVVSKCAHGSESSALLSTACKQD